MVTDLIEDYDDMNVEETRKELDAREDEFTADDYERILTYEQENADRTTLVDPLVERITRLREEEAETDDVDEAEPDLTEDPTTGTAVRGEPTGEDADVQRGAREPEHADTEHDPVNLRDPDAVQTDVTAPADGGPDSGEGDGTVEAYDDLPEITVTPVGTNYAAGLWFDDQNDAVVVKKTTRIERALAEGLLEETVVRRRDPRTDDTEAGPR